MALAVLVALVAWLSVVGASEGYVTEVNGTIYVQLPRVYALKFNATVVRVWWHNSSFITLSYTCVYAHNFSEECVPLYVEVYNASTLVYNVSFTNLTTLCSNAPVAGVCRGVRSLNVSGFVNVTAKVYNGKGELLATIVFENPFLTQLPDVLVMLGTLLPLALLVALAGRGNVRTVGIGMIAYGIVVNTLPIIGVENKYIPLVSVVTIIVGLVMVYLSK